MSMPWISPDPWATYCSNLKLIVRYRPSDRLYDKITFKYSKTASTPFDASHQDYQAENLDGDQST